LAAVNKIPQSLVIYLRRGWLAAFLLIALATLLPLLSFSVGERFWPGFFYAPFYTNNVLTDPTTPAAKAGLKPEDRVIGLNGVRIEYLGEITNRQGKSGSPISLVYELGRELAAINLPVERQNLARLLEKWVVFALGGLGLVIWGWPKNNWLALAGASLLVASGDYWLNPGAGRQSGFDPGALTASGEWGLATTKWSTYFYWPLWLVVWLVVGLSLVESLNSLRKPKLLKLLRIVIVTLALTQLAVYLYEAARTARYNNPDYITFYLRLIWWPDWAGLLALGLWAALRHNDRRFWLGLAGLLLGVGGFGAAVLFAVALPGPGPQWYALGLGLAGWAWAYPGNPARSRVISTGNRG
jgi:hypothetical protein